jgi:glycosyltransferase involved in cell wall biosynthesis
VIVIASPTEGGVAAVARDVVRQMRDDGLHVLHIRVGDGEHRETRGRASRRPPALVAAAAAWRVRRQLRGCEVAHLEIGRGSVGAFWFGIATAFLRRRRDLVLVAHDPPHIVRAPGSGLLRTAPGWRDAVAHRVLAALLDRPLKAYLRSHVARTVVLSDEAAALARRDAWPSVTVLDHGAGPPTPDAPPPSRGRHVLMAGFLGPGKGLDVLAEAWRRIGTPSLPLIVAGAARRQDRQWLSRIAGVLDRCPSPPQWLGYVTDEQFAHLVATAAVVVLPYRAANPASGVLIRALVEGRPVVATRVPAALAEVEPGKTGLLVDIADAAALAHALRRLLAHPRLRDELGGAAAARAAGRHSWRRHVDQLMAVYRGSGGHVEAGREDRTP